ncbi:MAG: hypothetical protein LBK47_03615 [Prevotellaceae bacterium]|jgi:nucleoid DNA-binding protein|nr:hypothetical protein [Prevotellaceae bacterium]
MEELAALLIELLKAHNRVSLPGLGAFVAIPQPAFIDNDSKTINPPSKKITFSIAETWNDGLVEQLYAQKHSISEEEAVVRVKHITMDVRFMLDANGKLQLPGLGMLKQGKTRDISFGQNRGTNLNGDSFGLSAVKIGNHGTAAKKEGKPVDVNTLPLIVLAGMVTLAAAIGLYLFLSGGTIDDELGAVLSTKPEMQVNASLAPAAQNEMNVEPQPSRGSAPSEVIVHQPARKPTPKPQQAAPKAQPAKSTGNCEYCIIVTSVSSRKAANIKVQTYVKMGYKNSRVVESGNKIRVAIGCYKSQEVARKELAKTQKVIKDAWLLEVKK